MYVVVGIAPIWRALAATTASELSLRPFARFVTFRASMNLTLLLHIEMAYPLRETGGISLYSRQDNILYKWSVLNGPSLPLALVVGKGTHIID